MQPKGSGILPKHPKRNQKRKANRTKRGLKKAFRKTGKFVRKGGNTISYFPGGEEAGKDIADFGKGLRRLGRRRGKHYS